MLLEGVGFKQVHSLGLEEYGEKRNSMPHLDLNHLSAKSRYEKYYIDAFTEQIHLDTRRDN